MKIELPQLHKAIELKTIDRPVSLLSVLVAHKIPIAHSCSGEGVCGTCWVEIEGNGIPKRTNESQKLWSKQFPQTTQKESQYFACLTLIRPEDSSKTWVVRCPSW